MKSKVKLSLFCKTITIVVAVLLLAGLWYSLSGAGNLITEVTITVFIAAVAICTLLYAPRYVEVTDGAVIIHSLLINHQIPMGKIESVDYYQPTMGAIRLFDSGGFMGHWGFYREGDMGVYQGFYGKASDCFIVVLDDGSKYVLGCENISEIVDAIKKYISKYSNHFCG